MSGPAMCCGERLSGLCVLCSLSFVRPARCSSACIKPIEKTQSEVCSQGLCSCWWLSHQGSLLPPPWHISLGLNVQGWGGHHEIREITGPVLVEPCKPLSEPWVLPWMWYVDRAGGKGRADRGTLYFTPTLRHSPVPPCPWPCFG